ncbi:MAG: dephospho-CoA kinase [Candidatus Omnitrophota bacterium]
MDKRIIIGVTGGLAAGKTTVVDMFAARGARKIDADEIAHDLLDKDGEINRKVRDLFGGEILTEGKIDRRKLAEKVFFDREKLDMLCRVLHPAIIKRIKERAAMAAETVVVIDAPLLIEAGLQNYVDIVIVVAAERQRRIERATCRGISKEEAGRIIDNQMPFSEKKKFADYIINGDKDLNSVKKGVREIWEKIREKN